MALSKQIPIGPTNSFADIRNPKSLIRLHLLFPRDPRLNLARQAEVFHKKRISHGFHGSRGLGNKGKRDTDDTETTDDTDKTVFTFVFVQK